jgi:uncharacterized membrane protein
MKGRKKDAVVYYFGELLWHESEEAEDGKTLMQL